MVDLEKITLILQNIDFQGNSFDLYKLGLVEDVVIKDKKVGCVLKSDRITKLVEEEIKKRILKATDVEEVNVVIYEKRTAAVENDRKIVPGVKNIIMVASGKGGVGKSTVAFFSALALAKMGMRVGLLDADLYGPSIPIMTKIYNKPSVINEKMLPHEFAGVKFNSIGYLMPEDKALAWRGPMVSKALHQLLLTTEWGNLDYLIIDAPPGTSDIHLTLSGNYKIDGVIIVSTSSDLALADVNRAIDMCNKFSMNILGVVENMSYLDIDGSRHNLFGSGEELDNFIENHKLRIISRVPFMRGISENSSEIVDVAKVIRGCNDKV